MKKLINDAHRVVGDSLEGIARLNPQLALIEGSATVVRADIEAYKASGKVALISGGGAGHEPAHSGYVGWGMLTAAVSGDVFASPSTDAVYEALRVVGTPAGVLMIVKNYTGDRINFGLAAEMARSEGLPVEIVVVDDDAALGSGEGTAGRRGIAGTVLVHKIAGAAAEAGMSLAEVAARATAARNAVASMGVALSACTVPAAGRPSFELGPDEIEFGLGIHGEKGVERLGWKRSSEIATTIVERLVSDRGISAGDEVALLVNNLGATPAMELAIVARDALDALAARGVKVERAYCGTYLTAIEMAGISLSVLKLDEMLKEALDTPAGAPAWRDALQPLAPLVRPNFIVAETDTIATSAGDGPVAAPALVEAVRAGCIALVDAEGLLTEMDQKVGDGDIGRSLANGSSEILARMESLANLTVEELLRTLSTIVRRSVGGTSGPLYAAFALGAAKAARDRSAGTDSLLADCFAGGLSALQALGGAREGDRTMVDALAPASNALGGGDRPLIQLARAAEAARAGAEKTSGMLPRLGRSSYLRDRAIGHPDPGAWAVAIWLDAAARVGNKPD